MNQDSSAVTIKRAICNTCASSCGVLVHVRDNQVLSIEGDPKNPDGKGFICQKGKAAAEFHTNPRRLNYPLKRMGKRGEGKWERISWHQAMDEIAQKVKDVKANFGPEAVAVVGGTVHEPGDWAFWRWCCFFGTPNLINQGRNCGLPEFLCECAMYGYHTAKWVPVPGVTRCAILWGSNPANSNQRAFATIRQAKQQGMKLVVIDPRLSETASQADFWLQLRPGTDGALGLAMINVIINEELYDKEFVASWCLGFDEIRDYVQEFPPERAQEITWVAADKIVEAARLYATQRPGTISRGAATHHIGRGCKSAVQAKAILRAITGNLDVEGSNLIGAPFDKYAWLENMHWDELLENRDRHRDNVSAHVFPLTSIRGYKVFREAMKNVYPSGYGGAMYMLVPSPGYIWRAILEEKPYPIKAVFTQGCNPLLVFAQPQKFYEAYVSDKLELHVASELTMTPTAQLADYVLPAADWLERPHVKTFWGVHDHYVLGEQSVTPLYDRKDDYYIWRELGIRLGQEKHWPETLEKMYDKFLEPSGMKFSEFAAKEEHWHISPPKYKKWESEGIATYSGKIELTPRVFTKLGIDPLPRYEEPYRSPVSAPEVAREYPLILITGYRVKQFIHSCFREIESLRKSHPDPVVEINPQTATELGIKDGDWIFIETPEGRVKQKARLTQGIDPRVVNAEFGWWYPERPGNIPRLFDTWESNINVVIPDMPECCDYAGDNYFRALLCRVYKA